jgi:hypothetical protein
LLSIYHRNKTIAAIPGNSSELTCLLKFSIHAFEHTFDTSWCVLSQLLEDFTADGRRTVLQMAENRRGSPVLRRIATALCNMGCRLETRLLRYKSPVVLQGYAYSATLAANTPATPLNVPSGWITAVCSPESASPAASSPSPTILCRACTSAEEESFILMEFLA